MRGVERHTEPKAFLYSLRAMFTRKYPSDDRLDVCSVDFKVRA